MAAAAAAAVLAAPAAEELKPFTSEDPGSESVAARRTIAEASGADPYFNVVALVRSRYGVDSPEAKRSVRRVVAAMRSEPAIAGAVSYYESHEPAMVSRDRRATYVVGLLRPLAIGAHIDAARRLEKHLHSSPEVTLGGFAFFYSNGDRVATEGLVRAELFAFPLLLLLTLWVFRGLVAALLPLVIGALTVIGAIAGLRLANELTEVSVYALNIATALGLGLAIDYSLLVLSRYREEMALSGAGPEALSATLRSAGRTVAFSSLTVACAASSLLVFPLPFLRSIGIGAILVALLAGASALVVLPALLAKLGDRVNALSPPRWRRAAERSARPARSGGWYRLSRLVIRRPGLIAAATAILLIAAGAPSLGIKLTQVDERVMPKDSSDRQVHETIAAEFPPSGLAPIFLAVKAPDSLTAERGIRAYARDLERLPGAREVRGPRFVGRGVFQIDVTPRRDSLSSQSERLVAEIRSRAAPYPVKVGGETASLVDLKASLRDRLPLAAAILVVLCGTAVFFMTGSLVLPLKALAMNALTISASFGALVLIFQNGALEDLFGYTSSHALEASTLVLIFAIAFGLATDYGIFLLSRIKEARDAGASDAEAVAVGLERTGRLVSAAALLLCVALLSLLTASHALIKQVGFGTAVAVAIDATIVRALLVPSLMMLLGRANWWAPAPLARLARGFAGPSAAAGPVRRSASAPRPARTEETLAESRYCD